MRLGIDLITRGDVANILDWLISYNEKWQSFDAGEGCAGANLEGIIESMAN